MNAPTRQDVQYRVGDMTIEQRRRVACLAAAMLILRDGTDTHSCDVSTVIRVARWLFTGAMPQ